MTIGVAALSITIIDADSFTRKFYQGKRGLRIFYKYVNESNSICATYFYPNLSHIHHFSSTPSPLPSTLSPPLPPLHPLLDKTMPLGAAIPIDAPVYPALKNNVPPHDGFGSEEDSLQTCTGTLPPPPYIPPHSHNPPLSLPPPVSVLTLYYSLSYPLLYSLQTCTCPSTCPIFHFSLFHLFLPSLSLSALTLY